jgi:D-amino peptidase
MMQGIGKDVDGVFFVGYHARYGSQNAVLDHTWSSVCVTGLWLNDSIAGEYTLNGALAGHYGAPVIMASGDQTACGQMAEQLGALETAVTKQASGRFSAECLAPEVTHKMIRESAARAVSRLMKKDAPKPFVVKAPVKITVQLATSDMADKAMQLPGVTRDGLKLSFVADNMPMAYSVFRVLVTLSYPR